MDNGETMVKMENGKRRWRWRTEKKTMNMKNGENEDIKNGENRGEYGEGENCGDFF